ncbi:MAG TPA: hypothetical protein VF345_10990 [Chthoniobacterales bacterium]
MKGAALPELGLDPYSSRMFFDHHFGNVESKSYAATILAIYLGETLEDGFDLLWGDSLAGIADGNLHFFAAGAGPLAAYANLAFSRCELNCVSNQI